MALRVLEPPRLLGLPAATQARAPKKVERASPMPAMRVRTGACAITWVSTRTRAGFTG